MGLFPPKVLFFPDNEPNYLNIYVEHPAGTGISVTNQTTKEVKDVIDAVLDKERTSRQQNTFLYSVALIQKKTF